MPVWPHKCCCLAAAKEQWLPIYMSTRSNPKFVQSDAEGNKNNAYWTFADEQALAAFLRSQGAVEGGNYKPQVWNSAASAMPQPEQGAVKTAAACKGKWARVHLLLILLADIRSLNALSDEEEFSRSRSSTYKTVRYPMDSRKWSWYQQHNSTIRL